MGFLINSHSFWRWHILQTTRRCVSLKYASTKVKKALDLNENITRKRKKINLYIPDLKEIEFTALSNYTCISLVLNSISWTKISLPDSALLEWGSYRLPETLVNEMNEVDILNLVNELKQEIPNSDLYVLETQKKWKSTINELRLRTTLITNLYNEGKDSGNNNRLIIQDCVILNTLYDLKIGWERKCTKDTVRKFFDSNVMNCTGDGVPNLTSPIKILENHKLTFVKAGKVKQESLSTALLMAFSVMDVVFHKNSESHMKLMKKLKIKKLI